MTTAARVTSIDAVREFRAALLSFLHDARDALLSVELENRRALEWMTEGQPNHWQNEIRRGEDAVQRAKDDLHRCRASPLPGGDTPSCMEEKKTLERAQQRLAHAREKAEATRRWARTVQHEIIEYTGRANQLHGALDADLPAAVAFLDRALASLDAYASSVPAPERAASTAGEPPTLPVEELKTSETAEGGSGTQVESETT